MQNYLVISAIGGDRPGIVDHLSQTVSECGGNVEGSRMAVFGSEFTIAMMVSGSWDAIAKIENALPRLERKLDLILISKRTTLKENQTATLQYMVEVIAMDHPGIIHDVATFFSQRSINIEDLYTSSYPAPHTGAPIFTMNLTIGVPGEYSIATLRGEFLEMCDALNLDAMLGPLK